VLSPSITEGTDGPTGGPITGCSDTFDRLEASGRTTSTNSS
jgi:hypothetical protein